MVQAKLINGNIFDIQGFSVHDGPGCRTLIFFKGCTLHCKWCSNPEGLSPFPEPLYKSQHCTFDSLCIEACEQHAIQKNGNMLVFDRAKCSHCQTYNCIKACCTGALNLGGYGISVEALYAKIIRDRQYWGANGGITLTGGEPFAQPTFAHAFLKRCYDAYIHTAVETCGNIPWENMEQSLPFLDWIFFDLKHMDPCKHEEATGSSNQLILRSALKLAQEFKGRLIFRMPVIPGFNDDSDHIAQMADFIQSTGRKEINILPVHHFGREKHAMVSQSYYTSDYQSPVKGTMEAIRNKFEQSGIHCYISNDTPF